MMTPLGKARGTALAVALLACTVSTTLADEPLRIKSDAAAIDRNGDGFQDMIVADRAVHHDIDGDGRFDYTLTLAFKEYTTEGHQRYLASGFDRDIFAELTRKGLDNLCASERVAANWTAEHFREYLYYHDGYGRLQIFDDSAENDGRLAMKSPAPRYEYTVSFNPDGSVASARRGDRTVSLAVFDYEKNTTAGTRLLLPKIERAADLAGIRDELGRLFETASGTP